MIKSRIKPEHPPRESLERLEIDPAKYGRFVNRTQKSRFDGVIRNVKSMRDLAADIGRSFLKGQLAVAADNRAQTTAWRGCGFRWKSGNVPHILPKRQPARPVYTAGFPNPGVAHDS